MRYVIYILAIIAICILVPYVFFKNVGSIVLNLFRTKKKKISWQLMPDMDITESYYHE